MKTFKEHRGLDEVLGGSMDPKKRLKAFARMKKGSEYEISFDSSMARNQKAKFKVISKNKVAKGTIEKITMQRLGKDGKADGVKHFLYNRGGNVSFAIGDLAATLTDIKT